MALFTEVFPLSHSSISLFSLCPSLLSHPSSFCPSLFSIFFHSSSLPPILILSLLPLYLPFTLPLSHPSSFYPSLLSIFPSLPLSHPSSFFLSHLCSLHSPLFQPPSFCPSLLSIFPLSFHLSPSFFLYN